MQTFLPHHTYVGSLSCLDNSRLGNQVYREAKTLLGGGWPNHPASKMWRGYEFQLALYCFRGAQEMVSRRYWKDEVCFRWLHYFQDQLDSFEDTGLPPWMGFPPLHASHRSNLLRKDPIYYGRFGWEEPDDFKYVWPVNYAQTNTTNVV